MIYVFWVPRPNTSRAIKTSHGSIMYTSKHSIKSRLSSSGIIMCNIVLWVIMMNSRIVIRVLKTTSFWTKYCLHSICLVNKWFWRFAGNLKPNSFRTSHTSYAAIFNTRLSKTSIFFFISNVPRKHFGQFLGFIEMCKSVQNAFTFSLLVQDWYEAWYFGYWSSTICFGHCRVSGA